MKQMNYYNKIFSLIILIVFSACTKINEDNQKPEPPSISVSQYEPYIFQVRVTGTDPDGDHLAYQFEIKDPYSNTFLSDWTKYFPSSKEATLLFQVEYGGKYKVKIHSRDEMNLVSDFSNTVEYVDQTLIANFAADQTTITQGGTVHFSDLSTNSPTNWMWNFGDGGTSSLQNPSHTYSNIGTYEVSLTSSNTYGSDMETKNSYIVVLCPCSGTVTDVDGNIYNVVRIGYQCWMTKNLKVAHYRNGDPIPNVTDNTSWRYLTTGAYCDYNNTPSNGITYGKLYNWYAVVDSRNICPTGWHIPSDAEWSTLTTYLGGESYAGGKLKETGYSHWQSPNTGATNETGFTALPGGSRYGTHPYYGDGVFDEINTGGGWWSSTAGGTGSAWYRWMYYNYYKVYRNNLDKANGFSVRCVKD